jgi:hypothetical protein
LENLWLGQQILKRSKMTIKNKKAQSETVGFVLIIIIVTIMMLTFLYFILMSNKGTLTTSTDMSYLLSSFRVYTTNCSTTFIPIYLTGEDLIKENYTNPSEKCLDGRTVSEALQDTLKEVIGKTLDVGDEKPIKSYLITVKYFVKGSKEENITQFYMKEGSMVNCSERYGGYSIIPASPGSLDLRLQVCKQKTDEE